MYWDFQRNISIYYHENSSVRVLGNTLFSSNSLNLISHYMPKVFFTNDGHVAVEMMGSLYTVDRFVPEYPLGFHTAVVVKQSSNSCTPA